MSLLGLLEDAPRIEVPEFPIPVSPAPAAESARPLTQAETARWSQITQSLGDVTLAGKKEATPIWHQAIARYPSLMLDSTPELDGTWEANDWLERDFETTWSLGSDHTEIHSRPRPRFNPRLWQESTRRSRPPTIEGTYEADAPSTGVLLAAIRVIKASPHIDEAPAIPLADQEVRSRLAPLQRRTAGASNAAEMEARATSPEYLAHMSSAAARTSRR